MLKIEFHSHTNHIQKWSEGNYSPAELIDRAVLLGFDALCITEHYFVCKDWPEYNIDPLRTYRDYKDYAAKKGLLLIPGAEVFFKQGEVLLINYDGNVKGLKEIEDLKKLPKSVLKIASHPFYGRGSCLGNKIVKYKDLLDGWEYCHFYYGPFNPNKKAAALAEKYGKPMIGTSDVHRLFQLNRTFTLVDAPKKSDAIVGAIRKKKHKIVSRQLPLFLFLMIFAKVTIGTIIVYSFFETRKLIKKIVS